MARLVVSSFVDNGSLQLYLDNELIGSGTQSVNLPLTPGQEYIIHWFIKGRPGSVYTISISSPKEAEFQLMHGLSSSGKDFGALKFKA